VLLHEINLDGVYVAPLAVLMAIAWIATVALRAVAAFTGWLRFIWHPPLFIFALYLIVLASIVFMAERLMP
jgi:protein AaeX